MKFTLREFQQRAVGGLLKKLRQAKRDLQDDDMIQAITFSAPTASGKTVMMTSMIERILFGKGGLEEHDDLDFKMEPDAVFLWLSDSPQLNQQSLDKMSTAASLELIGRLELVDPTFQAEYLSPGTIYFLNAQKLSVAGLLTKKSDDRQFSIWETINNTIARQGSRFYVIIDEAHRGMRRSASEQQQANSIIQKFIFGRDELKAAPLIIGVSATPERFDALLGTSRTRRVVDIPAAEARGAGLIKDFILMCHKDDKQPTEWTLLASACQEFRKISGEWERYCKANQEQNIVKPVLVIQIEDTNKDESGSDSRTSLAKLVEVVKASIPGLSSANFAHCLESGKTISAAGIDIRYLEPHRIEHSDSVRVVIFKMALTTGWDCPRAEVMMSFRRAEDATYIAQLVGRIVRTPLAKRVDGNDLLNSVMLFLPFFDRAQVRAVVDKLQGDGGESKGAEAGAQADFQTLVVAKDKVDLLEHYRSLPTYASQEGRRVADIRRALRLAFEFALDGWQDDALNLRDSLRATLLNAGETRRKTPEFKTQMADLSTVSYRMLRVENGVLKPDDPGEKKTLPVTEQDVDSVFSRSFVTLSEELSRAYVAARYDADDENAVYWKCKLELFLLSQDESVVSEVELIAQKLIDQAFDTRRAAIAKLSVERRAAYRRVTQISRHFKATEPSIPEPLRIKTDEYSIPLDGHLFLSDKGDFRAALNTWETPVLAAANKDKTFAGWLRNYPRKPWSIAYTYALNGETVPGYPDFVVFRKDGASFVADLLEPHQGTDALVKAHGLARFAEEHGDRFGRIEYIKVEGSQIKRLNLNNSNVRKKVLATNIDGALDSLFDSVGTTEAAPAA